LLPLRSGSESSRFIFIIQLKWSCYTKSVLEVTVKGLVDGNDSINALENDIELGTVQRRIGLVDMFAQLVVIDLRGYSIKSGVLN